MHTYAEAAGNFPGESIKSACAGTSFQEKFDAELRIINDPNNPKYKKWFLPEDLKEFGPHFALLAAWSQSNILEQENLPMSVKAQIVDSLTFLKAEYMYVLVRFEKETGYPVKDTDVLVNLYKSVRLENDPYFRRDTLRTVAKTLDAVSQLPELKRVQDNWATMPTEDKIAFLQKVHNIHAGVIGGEPYHVATFTQHPFTTTEEDSKQSSDPDVPLMRAGSGMIEVNMWVNPKHPERGPVGLWDLAECMDSILHEGSHVQDDYLHRKQAQEMKDGYEGIFLGSRRAVAYLSSRDAGMQGYRSNPTEVHAYYVGGLVGEFFRIEDPDEQSNYIAGLRAQAWQAEQEIINNHTASQDARRPNKADPAANMCPI